MKALIIVAGNSRKTEIKPFPLCTTPHQTRASPKYSVSHCRSLRRRLEFVQRRAEIPPSVKFP